MSREARERQARWEELQCKGPEAGEHGESHLICCGYSVAIHGERRERWKFIKDQSSRPSAGGKPGGKAWEGPEQGKAVVKVFSGEVIMGPDDGLERMSSRWSRRDKLRFPIFPAP